VIIEYDHLTSSAAEVTANLLVLADRPKPMSDIIAAFEAIRFKRSDGTEFLPRALWRSAFFDYELLAAFESIIISEIPWLARTHQQPYDRSRKPSSASCQNCH
jgi:hypothetical protein